MGREVRLVKPELDADGFFPKGPASVCVEGLPQRQCYTAPDEFGQNPRVAVVQLGKDMPALLFSAESVGGSGWQIHFALLRPGGGKGLKNLFASDLAISDLSQHAFFDDSSISGASIFVTAEFVWGLDEGHHDEHRYIISAYVRKDSRDLGEFHYYLEDRYMTAQKYDLHAKDILGAEKQEILARLRQIKAVTKVR